MTTAKERPILFQGAMVRALLDGSKTQTRRVVKSRYEIEYLPLDDDDDDGPMWPHNVPLALDAEWPPMRCPYGQPGDRLWVRESYADVGCRLTYRADLDDGAHCTVKKWTPSIHMFRADSRILLEIVSVRVERLNEISQADAMAEGVWTSGTASKDDITLSTTGCRLNHIGAYLNLWEEINGAGSWAANPFVWAISFKRVQ